MEKKTPNHLDGGDQHSAYCKTEAHEHGSACAVDCPTCAGGWNTMWRKNHTDGSQDA